MWRIGLLCILSAAALASAAVPSGHSTYVELTIHRDEGALVTCQTTPWAGALGEGCGPVLIGSPSALGDWTPTGVVDVLDGLPAVQVVAPGVDGPELGYVVEPPANGSVIVPLTGELASSPWPGTSI